MANKLFVGGLSWDTSDQGLKAAFSKFGSVQSAEVVKDKETGRSRGFGFVVMSDDGAADAAVKGMDGASVDGRSIKVNEAQSKGGARGERRGGGRDDRRGGGRDDRRGGGRDDRRGGRNDGGDRGHPGPSGLGTGYGGMGDGEPVW